MDDHEQTESPASLEQRRPDRAQVKSELQGKLRRLDFQIGDPTSTFEPANPDPIGCLRPGAHVRYFCQRYAASRKVEGHKNSVRKLLALGPEAVTELLAQDLSDTTKIMTLCVTLSAAKRGWTGLMHTDVRSSASSESEVATPWQFNLNASVSNYPMPTPLGHGRKMGLAAVGTVPPWIDPMKALNDGLIRYFHHALMTGMPTSQRAKYPELLQTELRDVAGSGLGDCHLSSGMDRLVIHGEFALQIVFQHAVRRTTERMVNCPTWTGDHSIDEAIRQTERFIRNLTVTYLDEDTGSDTLRAMLIKNSALQLAINQLDGILNQYDKIEQDLPACLERFRRFSRVKSEDDVLPAVAKVFQVPLADVPSSVLAVARYIIGVYLNTVSPYGEYATEFEIEHRSPENLAIAAGIAFHCLQESLEVSRGITGEHNAETSLYPKLKDYAEKIQEVVESGRSVHVGQSQAEVQFVVNLYSSIFFGLGSETTVHEGVKRHIRVKAVKRELQRLVHRRMLRSSVGGAIEFIRALCDIGFGSAGYPNPLGRPGKEPVAQSAFA